MIVKICFIDRVTFGQKLKMRECAKQIFGGCEFQVEGTTSEIPSG